jgi:preprotein translocase subunit SecA
LSNPKSNEFSNRLKQIVGKSFDESELKSLISAKDGELKEKIINKFSETRDERIKILGEDHAREIEKRIFLQSIDLNWKSHIQYLEQLRQVIGLRSYGQRDPLVEYKKEAFNLFSNLLEKLKLDFVTILMNLKVVTEQQEESKESLVDQIKSGKKIGRNEPCSCGSGKKFKHCCGAL